MYFLPLFYARFLNYKHKILKAKKKEDHNSQL